MKDRKHTAPSRLRIDRVPSSGLRRTLALLALAGFASFCSSAQKDAAEEAAERGGVDGCGCLEGDCENGSGVYRYCPSGDVYTGEFQNGQRHGKGAMQYADGDQYVGAYREGRRAGEGVYRWQNGESYEGDFQAGRREGAGVYSFADGAVFRGEFAGDGAQGEGVLLKSGQLRECSLQGRALLCAEAQPLGEEQEIQKPQPEPDADV